MSTVPLVVVRRSERARAGGKARERDSQERILNVGPNARGHCEFLSLALLDPTAVQQALFRAGEVRINIYRIAAPEDGGENASVKISVGATDARHRRQKRQREAKEEMSTGGGGAPGPQSIVPDLGLSGSSPASVTATVKRYMSLMSTHQQSNAS